MKHMSKIKYRSTLVFVVLCFVTSSFLGMYMFHLQRGSDNYKKTDENIMQNVPKQDLTMPMKENVKGFSNYQLLRVTEKQGKQDFQRKSENDISSNDYTKNISIVLKSADVFDAPSRGQRKIASETQSGDQFNLETSITKPHDTLLNTIESRDISAKTQSETNTSGNFKTFEKTVTNQRKSKLEQSTETQIGNPEKSELEQTTEPEVNIIRKSLKTYGIRRRFLNGPQYDITFEKQGFRVTFFQDKRKHSTKNKSNEKGSRKDTCTNCFKNDFQIILNQEHICNSSDIDIIIFISSKPSGFIERQTIRQTWGTRCNLNSTIKCVFVIGNSSQPLTNEQERLKNESFVYKDIVQFDFKDSYSNLTYKTLSGLRWAKHYCSSAKFVMKTDTDMFVNTFLLPYLLKKAPTTSFFGGFCWGPSTPHRDILSRWYVSFKSYRHAKFPAMCSGTGYVLSMEVNGRILEQAKNIPFFHLEDVYISLCLRNIGVAPVNLDGFSNEQQAFYGCNYKNNVITSHYLNPDLLNQYWKNIRNCSLAIHEETLYRPIPLKIVN